MKEYINDLQASRKNVLAIMQGLSHDQLNEIPSGFNNNIIWNAGHLIATQQLLCHKLAGLRMVVSDEFIDTYRKGTAPTSIADQAAIAYIKEWLLLSIDTTEKVIDEATPIEFKSYATSFGVTLNSFEDALRFNNIHEGLHLGYIMALKRMLSMK